MPRLPILLALGALIASSPVRGAPKPFDPERHFPKKCFFYVDVDFGALRDAFSKTPLGAVVSHPGLRRALGKAPDRLMEMVRADPDFAGFEEEMGMDIFRFLDLFDVRISMTSPRIDLRHGPQVVFAVDLEKNRKQIIEATERIARLAIGSRGTEAGTTEVRGYDVKRFQPPWGPPIFHAVLDRTVLFSVGNDLEEIIGLYRDSIGKSTLRSNPELREIRAEARDMKPIATGFLSVKEAREAMFEGLRQYGGPEAQARSVYEMLGLDKVSTVSYQLALTDGDWESKLLVLSPGGLSGALEVLTENISGPGDLSGLDRVPADASVVSCYSVNVGRLVREVDDILEKIGGTFPEATPEIEKLKTDFEELTGLSIRGDLYTLPRLSLYSFAVMPPLGSVLSDSFVVARSGELTPYVALIDRVARRFGASIEALEVADRVLAHLQAGGMAGGMAGGTAGGGDRGVSDPAWAAFAPGFSMVFAPIDDEWMLVASSPQGARRYLGVHAGAAKLSEDEKLMEVVSGRIGRTSAFDLYRDGKALLGIYNTFVSTALRLAPQLEHFLGPYEADPVHLPPGEEFLPLFKEGWVYVRTRPDSILVHEHRALTNLLASAIPWAGSIAMKVAASRAATAPVPVVITPESRARELYRALVAYTEKTDSRAFPNDPAGSLAAFRKLVESGVCDPSLLTQPGAADVPATRGPDGGVRLAEENVSWKLVPWKQGPSDSPSRLLCYEKKAFVNGGRHVIYVRGKVEFLDETEFLKLLDEQTARYGKKRRSE